MTLVVNPSDNAFRAVGGPFGIGEVSNTRVPHAESSVSHYASGEEVVGEGDPAENYFMVVKGVFRSVKVTRDGRRQIFAFYMPGDMCGLEPGATYDLTIEAVNAGSMAIISRTACRARMNRDPQFNAAVFDGATRALALSVDHMTMVGRSSAEERLAWFLKMLRDRASVPGRQPPTVDLVMQRQDIADYLGLTIETVSRTLTRFKTEKLIDIPNSSQIIVRNFVALESLATGLH